MARLSHEKIAEEIKSLGYLLVDDSGYQTLNSTIKVQCEHGHVFETNLNTLRRPSFQCPLCDEKIDFVNPKIIPPKTGTRVIGFDQATEHFGLSIWDNNQLVFYALYNFSGETINRIYKIWKFVREIVIDAWKPDYIIMEDIQQQHGAVLTYKILAMLLGVIQVACTEKNIQYAVVSPNVWRKYTGTAGKTRKEEKALSIAVVKQKFNINVSDDIAEAILIGQYGSKIYKKQYEWAFGEK